MSDALDRFSAPTRNWFAGAFARPTDAQDRGWDAIANGDHTLLCAPTGSGKTLAAFLWALDRLATTPVPEDKTKRLRVLYVSPLKALTYDVERNLRAPLTGMAIEAQRAGLQPPDIAVGTRTGDTPQEDRRALTKRPPDVLVTTPESLYLLLTSNARSVLASIEVVIIDEIHAVAATKRGTHLALSMERLQHLVDRAGGRFQRIGLSATQRPLEEVARFLGGRERFGDTWRERPVRIVDSATPKELDVQIVVAVEDMGRLGSPIVDEAGDKLMYGAAAGDPLSRHSIWPSVDEHLLALIRAHRSTLIFVNSRRLAERLAARLNELAEEELVRAHHGSIAREQRLEIEDMLKAGKLPALVATSTLELGIDMGAIDLVVCVEAPPSVASGLQRVGRAGHQVGAASVGRIFPKYRGDLVNSAVVVAAMKAGAIESTKVPRNPLDVLAQQIVAMAVAEPDGLSVDELVDMVSSTYPFAELTRDALDGVLDMLSGRYPSDEFAELRPRITWDRAAGRITARQGARMLAVTSGGTIPDRGLYGVFTPDGGRVGELDEEMVFECRSGETFVLGATTWRIEDITRDKVIVVPAPGEPGKMPFWKADIAGRPVELGRRLGKFLAELDDTPDSTLTEDCGLDANGITNLRAYVAEQREASAGLLPTDRQIVVERFRDELGDWRVCVLSPFGARVHAPWAMAIEATLRDRLSVEVQAMWTDDGIALRIPEADEAPPMEWILIDPDEVEDLVVNELGRSGVFAARFRENAARALLLPRRRPGSRTPLWQMRQRAADLLAVASNYGSFPILLETYRECLRDSFDVPALVELLRDMQSRKIRVSQVDTPVPSPFASGLANAFVASFLYELDAPIAERRAQALTLDRRLLAELVGSDELRDLLDGNALAALEDELQALAPERRVTSLDGAHDLLRRLGDLSAAELDARSDGLGFGDELVAVRRAITVRVAGEERYVVAEDAGRYRDALGVSLPVGLPEAFLEFVPDATTQLLRRWARVHGPFLDAEPAARFGLPVDRVTATLRELEGAGRLVRGGFRPGASGVEWCDVEVLRMVRQRSLAALRKQVEAVETDALVRFLPAWHGVGSRTAGIDRCFEVVGQLQGVTIPASVLERDVLSARVHNYSSRLLDELLASGEVLWVGAGPLGGKDGKVVLLRRDTAELLLPVLATPAAVDRPADAEHERIRTVLSTRGACFFNDLRGANDASSLEALWDLVWAGEVTNDSFAAVRALSAGRRAGTGGRAAGRPRPGRLAALGPPTAAGRWSLVPRDTDPPLPEPVIKTPQKRGKMLTGSMGGGSGGKERSAAALANTLLERYGVLTRDAVRGEGVFGGFAAVYPVLRAMEEGGRIRRGYFVTGLGGSQFALPGAVERMRAAAERDKSTYVLAATDPANPFGVALPWPTRGPQRAAGAFVVIVDGELVLYLEKGGRSLVTFDDPDTEPDPDRLASAVQALADLVDSGRFTRLVLNKYPEALEQPLRDAGFAPSPKGLTRYPRNA